MDWAICINKIRESFYYNPLHKAICVINIGVKSNRKGGMPYDKYNTNKRF